MQECENAGKLEGGGKMEDRRVVIVIGLSLLSESTT